MDDLISRQMAIDAIERNAYRHTYIDQIVDIINALPSAQPEQLGTNLAEVGTDLISRAEAIETVTKCNAKDMSGFDWIRMQEAVDKLKDLPSAQPCMQTCKSMYADVSDLVSRQAALEALRTCYDTDRIDMDNGDEYIDYNDAVGEIEELPSAQPELSDEEKRLIKQLRSYHNGSYARVIDKLIAFAQPMQWILVSETVDIPDYEVLCCDRCGEELVGWLSYVDEQWVCESNGEMMYNPVAWMPLPEPYREEGKQE